MEYNNNFNDKYKKIHIKCVLLGDSGVGKTTLCKDIRNTFNLIVKLL